MFLLDVLCFVVKLMLCCVVNQSYKTYLEENLICADKQNQV